MSQRERKRASSWSAVILIKDEQTMTRRGVVMLSSHLMQL